MDCHNGVTATLASCRFFQSTRGHTDNSNPIIIITSTLSLSPKKSPSPPLPPSRYQQRARPCWPSSSSSAAALSALLQLLRLFLPALRFGQVHVAAAATFLHTQVTTYDLLDPQLGQITGYYIQNRYQTDHLFVQYQ
mmetsp:Transcript_35780/g.78381  ORF Transcript_35780/g.78381 Transcript_35780/m.78381 type:complete len:137 (+) Transcript_35780:1-411(+)